MQNFYDDVIVHGEVKATKLSGELSEQTRAPFDNLISELRENLQITQDELVTAQQTIGELAERYNKAIEVINNLSERVTALESNYDPTVIGEPPAITNKENKS